MEFKISLYDIKIIAKNENTNNISDILKVLDGVMIGRGDLALNIPANNS